MALIPYKTLLRLDLHILFTGYLENGSSCFIKVTEHDNIDFDHKILEDEDSKKDSKKAVINSEEKTRKKKV